jgi:hypothetical protein
MLRKQIEELIYTAFSLSVVALVIINIVYLNGLKSDINLHYNDLNIGMKAVSEYREFNKYDANMLYGEDIIEAVRLYYNQDIEIVVLQGGTEVLRVNKDTVASNENIVSISSLQAKFNRNDKYLALLAFDMKDPRTITGDANYYKNITRYNRITGIVFIKQ